MRRGRPSGSFPPHRQRWPVDRWPAADRAAWEALVRPAEGPFDPGGPGAGWVPDTRRLYSGTWGSFLAHLDGTGRLDPAATPAARLTRENVESFCMALADHCRSSTLRQAMLNLYWLARHFAPEGDWRFIRHHPLMPTEAAVRSDARPVRTTPMREVIARCEAELARITELRPSVGLATRFMSALIVMFGAWRPIRRRNLHMIRIGRHLRLFEGEAVLEFDAAETKTDQKIRTTLPPGLRYWLEIYLERYRPILLRGAASDVLWISRNGDPLSYGNIYHAFRRVGRELFGHPLKPHQMRHNLADDMLGRDGFHIGHAAAALTHRGRRMADSVYGRRNADRTFADWHADLARMRRGEERDPDDEAA